MVVQSRRHTSDNTISKRVIFPVSAKPSLDLSCLFSSFRVTVAWDDSFVVGDSMVMDCSRFTADLPKDTSF
jgi:hypothetical protein